MLLKQIHYPEALFIVTETARMYRVQYRLSVMTERRMSKIVSERYRIGKIRVQIKDDGNRSGDLIHLQRMCQSRSVMVIFRGQKNLRLVHQPSKGL